MRDVDSCKIKLRIGTFDYFGAGVSPEDIFGVPFTDANSFSRQPLHVSTNLMVFGPQNHCLYPIILVNNTMDIIEDDEQLGETSEQDSELSDGEVTGYFIAC